MGLRRREAHRELESGIHPLQGEDDCDRQHEDSPFDGVHAEPGAERKRGHADGDLDPRVPLSAQDVRDSLERVAEGSQKHTHIGCVPKITAVARAALEQYLYLLDEAFAGDDWHSLLSNLKALAPEDWLWLPPDGARPIAEMVSHVAACKNMYGNHAFGDASMTWEDPLADQKLLKEPSAAGIEQLRRFLKEAHARLRAQVDTLSDDAELVRPRRTNWGDTAETRWIIKATIEHDLYHAGEINRMRALRQANDRWAFEQFT